MIKEVYLLWVVHYSALPTTIRHDRVIVRKQTGLQRVHTERSSVREYKQVRSACKQTGLQHVQTNKVLSACINLMTHNLLCIFESHGNTGFVDYRFLNYYVTVFVCFFFHVQNLLLCLEKPVHLSRKCSVLTDPPNFSALALSTCMQCVPIFLNFYNLQ